MSLAQGEKQKKNFYDLSIEERLAEIGQSHPEFSAEDLKALSGSPGLSPEQANHMIENVVGTYALPLGIARNFIINGKETLVPMVIEEPSVVAGASFMAKLARASGGFLASTTPPEMIAQIQVLDIQNLATAEQEIDAHKAEILEAAGIVDPVLSRYGGGPRDLETRIITPPQGDPFLVVHLIVDVRDAMGANAVNSVAEKIAPLIEKMTGGRVNLRILSNLADRRLARSQVTIRLDQLAFGEFQAEQVRDDIIAAWAFAAADPYRAATHNKGIM
ncbi:MAG: 3-hydroxy-3-methylglutaryl-CoA reductase, partial [Anaerolineaceae bacterium]